MITTVSRYVVAEESEKGKAFLEEAKSLLSADDFNRFTFTGYAGARTMFEPSAVAARH